MAMAPTFSAHFLSAVVAGFAVLGGFMAVGSGLLSSRADQEGGSPDELAYAFNLGAARGFSRGVLPAILGVIYLDLG